MTESTQNRMTTAQLRESLMTDETISDWVKWGITKCDINIETVLEEIDILDQYASRVYVDQHNKKQ